MKNCRGAVALAVVLTLAACGGDSSGPSEPPFPLIGGVYDYDAQINGIPEGKFTGTLTIADDSRETTQFTGTAIISLVDLVTGETLTTLSADIQNAYVTEEGSVRFDLEDSSYRHTGALTAGSITGTWILSGTTNYSGSFTAVRR